MNDRAPAGRTPAAPPARYRNTGPEIDTPAFLSMNILVREARKVAADLGYERVGNSSLRRIVRRFTESGKSNVDFSTWFVGYLDPTGETAVRNVMKGAAR
jgi:hypothetical protein